MATFEEVGELLDEIASELPADIFAELNGGVNLLPDEKPHPEGGDGGLCVMGEYCHNSLGRYINIYYGSVMRVYPYLHPRRLKDKLAGILKHEFTHHLESLAGERELMIKDSIELERYKGRSDQKHHRGDAEDDHDGGGEDDE